MNTHTVIDESETNIAPAGQGDETGPVIDQQETSDATQPAAEGQALDNDAGQGRGNAEAAKWRRQYREAETQLAGARSQIDSLTRQLVEAVLPHQVKPPLFFAHHNDDLTEFITDEGIVDLDAVQESAKSIITEYGLFGVRQSPGQGIDTGFLTDSGVTSWGDALSG